MAAGNNFILFNLEGVEQKLNQYIQSPEKMLIYCTKSSFNLTIC